MCRGSALGNIRRMDYRALMFRMTVQDVFAIKGRGTVATGRVEYGQLSVGDHVRINDGQPVRVDAIEAFRKKLDTAATGDNIGILFRKLATSDLAAGDVLTSGGVYLA
jgi:elongation factor Tu